MLNLFNPQTYPDCCELTMDKKVYISDNGQSTLIDDEEHSHVVILNPKEQELTFLKIDHCILTEQDAEKCDCSILNAQKIYFIEIKELLFTNSANKRSKKRRKARSQLSSTINHFKGLYGDQFNLNNVYAIVSLIPRMEINFTQPIQTRDQKTIDKFSTACGCVNIFEGNQISF